MARFTKNQCQPRPVRAKCTTSWDSARNAGFLLRQLLELQLRHRAEQQEPAWHKRYAGRSGIEGTICEFAHGHGMRHCRYRGQPKAHLQHVLTALAVDVERLSRPAKARPHDHRQSSSSTSTSSASRAYVPGEPSTEKAATKIPDRVKLDQ
jgi:hypothetical protein